MSSAGSTPDLPQGWTIHELNGSIFYYNKSMNKIQQEPPISTLAPPAAAHVELHPSAPPMSSQAMSSAALSSTAVSEIQQPQPQPVVPQQPQQPQPVQAQLAPRPVQAQLVQVQPQLHQQPQPQLQAQLVQQPQQHQPLTTALEVPLGCDGPPPQSQTPFGTPPQIQRPQPSPQVAQPPSFCHLQVLVPQPGLQPGQQLAFMAPGSNNGPPMPMAVTVQEAVAPGSVVTVQIPDPESRPSTIPAPPSQGPGIPLPTVDAAYAEDRNAMVTSWWLYAAGWLCACVLPPCCMLPWGISAVMYFCKPRQDRTRRSQQRAPACVSLWTVVALLVAGLFGFIAAAALGEPVLAEFGKGHHWRHHHVHHGTSSTLRGTSMWNALGDHTDDDHHHHHHHEHSHGFSWEHAPEPKFSPQMEGVAPFGSQQQQRQQHDVSIGADPVVLATTEEAPAPPMLAPKFWRARAQKAAQAPKAATKAPSADGPSFVA